MQPAAVHHHLQQRLDKNINVLRQVRDKRNVDVDMLDRVMLYEQLIVELHVTVRDLNIGNRKSHRRAGGRGLRFLGRRTFEQIGKVEPLLVRADHVNRRPIDRYFADHRRESKQRRPRNLEPQMAHIDKRRRTIALADVQLVDIEPQPIKIETDFAHAHLAMDALGDRSGHDVTQDRRHREIRRDPEKCDDSDHDQPDFAGPAMPRQLTEAYAPRHQVLARSLEEYLARAPLLRSRLARSLYDITHA